MLSLTSLHSSQSLTDVCGAPVSYTHYSLYIGEFKDVTKAKPQPLCAYDLKA